MLWRGSLSKLPLYTNASEISSAFASSSGGSGGAIIEHGRLIRNITLDLRLNLASMRQGSDRVSAGLGGRIGCCYRVVAGCERERGNVRADWTCPGSCTCWKIMSCSAPLMARQDRIRRSSVRRMPGDSSGWRRSISSKIATGRRAGASFRSGTTPASKMSSKDQVASVPAAAPSVWAGAGSVQSGNPWRG